MNGNEGMQWSISNKLDPRDFMQLGINELELKCTKCGANLEKRKQTPPNPIPRSQLHPQGTPVITSHTVTTGAISGLGAYPSLIKNAISLTMTRNDHLYTGYFCRWECMIEWLNDDLLPQMVGDVITE